MSTVPARRRPNTSLTEADWQAAMQAFLAGASDAEVARANDVSPSTVAAQRFKRGVYRRHRKAAPAPFPGPAAAAGAAVAAEADGPVLVLPESGDARETAAALLAHSGALAQARRMNEAATAARLARSFLLTARLQGSGAEAGPRRAADEAEAAAWAAAAALPELRPAQRAPSGAWRSWLFLGGRGAGKTLAGAAWLAGRAQSVGRLALVGPTYGDVREVMIEGPSGLRGAAAGFGPQGARPRYEPSRRRLLWLNGAVAQAFTAEDPDGLRGPQFGAAWADEVCAWPRPAETLALLRMGLRLGEDPRLALTTTPRPTAALRALLAEQGLALTRGSALDNAAHLSPGFVDDLRALYGGTRWERQEIDGEVLEALEGAVFRRADLDRARAAGLAPAPEVFDRLVVAVDPPAGRSGAACGVVVAGRLGERAWVLEDATAHGLSPAGWAGRVAAAAQRAARRGPVTVVAEANQGGEMVRQVLVGAGLEASLALVHARLSKRDRAEPVALLYEQDRIAHARGLDALEDQMLLLGGVGGGGEGGGASPDRADALVWALTTLMLRPEAGPRVRALWD
jgi:phage terminase large subunit-like protein/transposase-like protein